MRHAFVAEQVSLGRNLINEMARFDLFQIVSLQDRKLLVRLPYSGRLDEINIITNERDAVGYRFDGQLHLLQENTFTNELFMYLRHNRIKYYHNGQIDDPETQRWLDYNYSDAFKYYDLPWGEKDIWKLCLK